MSLSDLVSTQPAVSLDLEQLAINTIRFLSVDGVDKAKSGHPGAPMGMAAMAYTLWTKHLKFDPNDPEWFDRDRFVLSNGHASMLLYSMLHLTGYDLSLDDLKNFRQWNSKTPGHPERGFAPGVEVTTGPLGQGFSNAVGMAIAEQFLASTFNKAGHDVVDHYTYVFAGDGCMMEGITSEAASMAGHLELGKLICLYDDNEISIDGETRIAFTEDVGARYESYGWQVIEVPNGNDVQEIDRAIRIAKAEASRPSLIVCHTHIGYGSPNRQDTSKAHGMPLGKDETALAKQKLGWPLEPTFHVPEEALAVFRDAGERGTAKHGEWNNAFSAYRDANAKLAESLERAITHTVSDSAFSALPVYDPKDGAVATRQVNGKVLSALADKMPTLIGGSADLYESTFTKFEKLPDFEPSELKGGKYSGRTINFGVREHAMGAIVNGLAAHGGIYPFGSTFFTFSDYMRPSVRLAAIMDLPSIFIWTHDSVGLGEDGPTHQPIEHLMSLRAMPNFTVIRPADANEAVEAWKFALQSPHPTGMVQSRQKLPVSDPTRFAPASNVSKGAYILSEASQLPAKLILIATGSEVSLAVEAQADLEAQGIATRVVSMPSFELFAEQPAEYRERVLSPDVRARLSIELGCSLGWERWVGDRGASLAIDHFGASAPYETILKEFGFTRENVVALSKELLTDPESVRRKLRAGATGRGGHISTAPASGDEGHS